MSPRSDDRGVNPRRTFDERTADALLSGREVDGETELSALLAEMRRLEPAPAPNAALSAMLEDGFTPDVVPLPEKRARRTWALPLQLALGSAACLGLLFGAAAAGELPGPAQTAVADVVEAVTPLHVPRPVPHPVPAVVPSPTRSAEPSPAAGEGSHEGATPRPSQSSDDHSGTGGGGGGDDSHDGRPSATPSAGDHSDGSGSGSNGSGSSGSGSSGSSGSGPDSSDDTGKDPSGGRDGRTSGSGSGSSGVSGDGGSPADSHLSGTGETDPKNSLDQ